MFVAVVPPQAALDDLAQFLAPRQDAGPELRWTVPEQWHLTLAFMADVPERRLDDLTERLGRAAGRRTPFEVTLAGGGAFPDPGRAKVVYVAVETDDVELRRLATGARAAASKAGAGSEGGRFHPHVTLARAGRPVEATRWLRVLDAYRGPTWRAAEVALIGSHLGEGPRRRPRYEVVETFTLGRQPGLPRSGRGNDGETRP
jgi:2'-5' RNA ligase